MAVGQRQNDGELSNRRHLPRSAPITLGVCGGEALACAQRHRAAGGVAIAGRCASDQVTYLFARPRASVTALSVAEEQVSYADASFAIASTDAAS